MKKRKLKSKIRGLCLKLANSEHACSVLEIGLDAAGKRIDELEGEVAALKAKCEPEKCDKCNGGGRIGMFKAGDMIGYAPCPNGCPLPDPDLGKDKIMYFKDGELITEDNPSLSVGKDGQIAVVDQSLPGGIAFTDLPDTLDSALPPERHMSISSLTSMYEDRNAE
jgi:hypothetical protein